MNKLISGPKLVVILLLIASSFTQSTAAEVNLPLQALTPSPSQLKVEASFVSQRDQYSTSQDLTFMTETRTYTRQGSSINLRASYGVVEAFAPGIGYVSGTSTTTSELKNDLEEQTTKYKLKGPHDSEYFIEGSASPWMYRISYFVSPGKKDFDTPALTESNASGRSATKVTVGFTQLLGPISVFATALLPNQGTTSDGVSFKGGQETKLTASMSLAHFILSGHYRNKSQVDYSDSSFEEAWSKLSLESALRLAFENFQVEPYVEYGVLATSTLGKRSVKSSSEINFGLRTVTLVGF
ncbi:MAG: hypothetical protein AB7O96_10075 [Pseudobdellovibrionaceae bacterium]